MNLKAFSSCLIMVCLALASCAESADVAAVSPALSPTKSATITEHTAVTANEQRPELMLGVPALENLTSLSSSDISMLKSLRQIGEAPLYFMEYHGDYDSKARAALYESLNIAPDCSTFAIHDSSETFFARNHDFMESPVLMLYNKPDDGYASISLVDIRHLGFGNDNSLTQLPLEQLSKLLYAPYVPVDGMNECGLAVGTMSVPQASNVNSNEPKMFYLEALRMILDHAQNTSEAISLLEDYQIEFNELPSHFMIADKTGDMAVIEFVEGKMQVLRSKKNWIAATNFVLFNSEDELDAYKSSGVKERDLADDSFWRYSAIQDTLIKSERGTDFAEVMDLLETVSRPQTEWSSTQWSVVYGLESGRVDIVIHMDYNHPISFRFGKEEEISIP